MSQAGEKTVPHRERELYTHKTFVYGFVRFSVACGLRTLWRSRIENAHFLPKEGGAVIACNHQSGLDIPIIAHSTRRHICFVARDTLANFAPMAFLMRQCGAVLVSRGSADRDAVKEMIEHVQRGDLLAIFPEGTRTLDGSLGEFKGGALLAARRAGVPVIPAAIRGAMDAWPRGKRLPRLKRVAIRYAAPLDSAAPDALERTQAAIESMLGDGSFGSVPPV